MSSEITGSGLQAVVASALATLLGARLVLSATLSAEPSTMDFMVTDAKSSSRLTLVVGPPNSGKLGRVLAWWREREAARPIIVSPTVPDARDLTAEMVQRFGGLWGQSAVVTFDGLLAEVCGRRPTFASPQVSFLLVDRLLATLPLKSRGLDSRAVGVVEGVRVLLDRLLESGRSLAELSVILKRWKTMDSGVGVLADDLRLLLEEYWKLRESLQIEDRGQMAEQAVGALAAWSRPVAFYGFTSFTSWQGRLVERLAEKVEILLTLTYDSSREVNLVSEQECLRWRARASEVQEIRPQPLAYSSPSIAYLEANFLEGDGAAAAPPPSGELEGVRFLLASGRRNEGELVALEVARLLRSGFRPRDIAVVVRRVEPWRRVLGDVFHSCGIPYRMDYRRPLWETGLGHAFLAGLRGLLTEDTGLLLSYLRSPYSNLDAEETGEIERRFRRGARKGLEAFLALAEGTRPEVLKPLQQALCRRAGVVTLDVAQAVEAARCMLRAGLSSTSLDSDEALEDAQAYHALASALWEVAALGGSFRTSDPFDAQTLLAMLARVPLPADLRGSGDAVQVLSVHRARARRFPVMVILGLVEGEFPGREDSPRLLSERQRRALDAVGGGLLPDDREEEVALFLGAVSRAWQVLLLSARDAEEGGAAALPSYFWTRSKELLRAQGERCTRRSLSEQLFPLSDAPSWCHYRRACAAAGAALAGGVQAPVTRGQRRVVGPPRRLENPSVVSELAQTSCFSPSALESYARCPTKWFLEKVVGVEELDTEFDARFMGQSVHRLLAEVYRRLSRAGLLPLGQDGLDGALELAEEVLTEWVDEGGLDVEPVERRLVLCRLRSMVSTVLRAEARAHSSLRTEALEVEVGGGQGVDIGGLRIRGRIDRIDRLDGAGGLFIYDYKTGALPRNSELGSAEGLQVPLYVVSLLAERPDQPLLGGAYVSARDGARSGVYRQGVEDVLGKAAEGLRGLDDAAWAALLDAAREVAATAVAGIRSGLVAPQKGRECPRWCRLGPICRARRGGTRR